MDIVFYCPECNQQIEAPSPYAGKNILCPNCKTEITVPSALSENTNIQLEPQEKDEITSNSEAISNNNQSLPPQYNEVVYTLLGIFLGVCGSHNFYKREYISGTFRVISLLVALIIPAYQNNLSGLSILILGTSYLLVTFELGFQRKYTTK